MARVIFGDRFRRQPDFQVEWITCQFDNLVVILQEPDGFRYDGMVVLPGVVPVDTEVAGGRDAEREQGEAGA